MIKQNAITVLMMERQHLINKANKEEYNILFKMMSPVQTVYWTRPGDPPTLSLRSNFDDFKYNDFARAERKIVKGRFQGGNVAYVFYDDLELFASAYINNDKALTYEELNIIDLLRQEGPMNIGLVKEITGLLTKQITPVLQKLQKKFIVYEDQISNDLDRAWYLTEDEFSSLDLNRYSKIDAIKKIILRFIHLNVWVNEQMIKSFYKFPVKDIKTALKELDNENEIKQISINDKTGYVLLKDEDLLLTHNNNKPRRSVFVFHRSDFLVKSNEYWLKEKFKQKENSILHYILIDGEFKGAVVGKFKNGPFIIEDVVIHLDKVIAEEVKYNVIEAIYEVYDSQSSPVKRYCGISVAL